ncbi:hypothetical protein HJFPF1_00813 [Paramyrothecium foliicola]|nr:hypothetical protein HJFPF1_00813 [Paramyrothecium foliicola]
MSFPLPASPTLTNPDMILPDYPDYGRADSPEHLPEARLTAWRDPSSSNHGFHLPMHNGYSGGPLAPATPIIYGNGTMLSDIGEVTEVESNAGHVAQRSSSRYSHFSDDGRDLHTPPAVAKVLAARRGHAAARRASIDSTSTITTQENGGNFTDFDDLVSVDDSFQGDDEQSMASSYVDDNARQRQRPAAGLAVAEPNTDRYSTSLLSKKAEEILANAKRRLTKFSWLTNTFNRFDSITSHIATRYSITYLGVLDDIKTLAESKRHNALGAAGGYRQPLLSPKASDGFNTSQSTPTYGISHHPLDTTLEPLGEDSQDASFFYGGKRDNARMSMQSVGSISIHSELGMTRCASAAQVRDLQDQMNGLRGKISSLREQARADSLKRRSLQSLRTPSPFTHARWDQGYMEPRDIKNNSTDNAIAQATGNAEIPLDSGAKPEISGSGPGQNEPPPRTSHEEEKNNQFPDQTNADGVDLVDAVNGHNDDTYYEADDMHTENGDVVSAEEAVQNPKSMPEPVVDDDASESGESLYHDTYQAPISHEDREDAFDYEHFFLHSAMGTISHGRFGRKGGPGSVSSEDSIETTRPITPAKRASLETISSVETFATADEGRASRSSEYQALKAARAGRESADSAQERTGSALSRGSGEKPSTPPETRPRGISVLHRPVDATTKAKHRPSVASFESTGTNRSFPLLSPRSKGKSGIWTPGGSPDDDLKHVSDALMKETLNFCDADSPTVGQQTPPLELLGKEDRILVERLVATLGKCVLGLGEASRASTEARAYRRRLDAARRVLEGLDD